MIFFLIMTLIPHHDKGLIDKKINAFSTMKKCQDQLEIYNRGSDYFVDPKTNKVYTMKFECMMEMR